MSIVFGLGSGRCGTKTLQSLINMQPNSVCFHEVNPSCMAWEGTEHTVISILDDFTNAIYKGPSRRGLAVDLNSPERGKPLEKYISSEKLEVVGDVASYYLPYVETIISSGQDVVFPCLIRNKDEVVNSFINKVRCKRGILYDVSCAFRGKISSRNHWSSSNRYIKDPKWDRLHPDMGRSLSLREALSMYYDYYYEEIERLSSIYSNVKMYDISVFNSEEGVKDLLKFCGIKKPVVDIGFHENKGTKSG